MIKISQAKAALLALDNALDTASSFVDTIPERFEGLVDRIDNWVATAIETGFKAGIITQD